MGSKGKKKPSLRDLANLPMDVEAYFKELLGESDRACALIAGSALSAILKDLLKGRFVELKPEEVEHLFDGQQATLADFASRTEIAYALGLLDKKERKNLHLIRQIRNAFAHTVAVITFQTKEVSDACKQLVLFGERSSLLDERVANEINRFEKNRFIASAMSQYIELMAYSHKLHESKITAKYLLSYEPTLEVLTPDTSPKK